MAEERRQDEGPAREAQRQGVREPQPAEPQTEQEEDRRRGSERGDDSGAGDDSEPVHRRPHPTGDTPA